MLPKVACQNWTLKYILYLKTFYEISAFFVRLMLANLVVVELKHSIKLTPGSVVPLTIYVLHKVLDLK